MADITKGTGEVIGKVAEDVALAGNPLAIGLRADDTEPAAVSADGDSVFARGDRRGRVVQVPYFPPQVRSGDTYGPKTVTVTATTNAALLAAPGASNSIHLVGLMCGNTSATLTRLDLVEGGTDAGTDGTIVASQPLAASGGGFVWPPHGWAYVLPANTALKARLGTGVTDVRVNLTYFVAATPP